MRMANTAAKPATSRDQQARITTLCNRLNKLKEDAEVFKQSVSGPISDQKQMVKDCRVVRPQHCPN